MLSWSCQYGCARHFMSKPGCVVVSWTAASICLFVYIVSSVGGSLPIAFAYFSEFFSTRHRNRLIIILSMFWMVGMLFTSLLAWVMQKLVDLGSTLFTVGSLEITGWRVFLMLCTFPCLSAAFLMLFMPESPSFLFEVTHLRWLLTVVKCTLTCCYVHTYVLLSACTCCPHIVEQSYERTCRNRYFARHRYSCIWKMPVMAATLCNCMIYYLCASILCNWQTSLGESHSWSIHAGIGG